MKVSIDTSHEELSNKYRSQRIFKKKINVINRLDFNDLNHFHGLIYQWVQDKEITFKMFHLIMKHYQVDG